MLSHIEFQAQRCTPEVMRSGCCFVSGSYMLYISLRLVYVLEYKRIKRKKETTLTVWIGLRKHISEFGHISLAQGLGPAVAACICLGGGGQAKPRGGGERGAAREAAMARKLRPAGV